MKTKQSDDRSSKRDRRLLRFVSLQPAKNNHSQKLPTRMRFRERPPGIYRYLPSVNADSQGIHTKHDDYFCGVLQVIKGLFKVVHRWFGRLFEGKEALARMATVCNEIFLKDIKIHDCTKQCTRTAISISFKTLGYF